MKELTRILSEIQSSICWHRIFMPIQNWLNIVPLLLYCYKISTFTCLLSKNITKLLCSFLQDTYSVRLFIVQSKECADHQKQCYSPCWLLAQTCLYALCMGYLHRCQISCTTAGWYPCQMCRHYRQSALSLYRALQMNSSSVIPSLGIFDREHGPCNEVVSFSAQLTSLGGASDKKILSHNCEHSRLIWYFLHVSPASANLQGMIIHSSACARGLP